MMKKHTVMIIRTILLLILAGVSCTKEHSFEKLVEKQLYKQFQHSTLCNYHYILLIPNGGCTGCVQQAENYFLHHQNDKETLFIFTNFASRKSLSIRLGKESLNRSNVWLDHDNSLYFPKCAESVYPCVIFLEKGKVNHFTNLD